MLDDEASEWLEREILQIYSRQYVSPSIWLKEFEIAPIDTE